MQRPIPYTSVIIDPASDLQVHHWAKDMQIQPYELRAAVALVGPRLSDLRRYFGKSAPVICLMDRRPNRQTIWTAFPPVA
jgi:hypothetical protein